MFEIHLRFSFISLQWYLLLITSCFLFIYQNILETSYIIHSFFTLQRLQKTYKNIFKRYFILEPLRVSITPAELRLEVGKTATLNCSVFGSPTGTVLWRKDMMMLQASSRISFPNSYLLQVRQIRRPDAGVYQCFIQRELYSSQASSVLIIGGKYPL